MKTIKTQAAICVQVSAISDLYQAVSFSQAIDDVHKHAKPQWTFIMGPGHGFEIGKQYALQICDPQEAAV